MFGEERHDEIIKLLGSGRVVPVGEIAKRLFVSEATVRRDLNQLEKEGVVRRVYGGAVLSSSNRDVPLLMREGEAFEAKQKIGRIAASMVRENDVIMLDASSTVYNMIQYLRDFKNLVVITSGVKSAMALGERHIKTYLTGGSVVDNSFSMVGNHAAEFVRHLNVDTFFFSCRGISEDGQLTDSSVDEAQLRQLMMQHSKRNVCLMSHNKIGRSYFYVLGQVQDMDDIICDEDVPESFRRAGTRGKAPIIHTDL